MNGLEHTTRRYI